MLYPGMRDTIRATVLSSDPPRLQLPNGSVAVTAIGMILFPAELFEAERVTLATVLCSPWQIARSPSLSVGPKL